MRRLVDGAYAVVASAPRTSEVASIATPRRLELDAEHAPELRRLAHGEPESVASGPAFAKLKAAGLADDGLDADDPLITERLAVLGGGYAWHAGECPRGAELATMLRRMHARRKLSLFEFGQTAALPECGVARCWQLTRRAGRKKRVLLIGDDDLLSLVLARMGHDVTVIDIDDVLIDFIRRCAKDEGITLDARVQDVLAPMPRGMAGRFDVVLTDPMSYEGCLLAFLSRATSAVRKGGLVLTCVHPLARRVFERVAGQLPVTVDDVMHELSVYYYQGFVENWYRSDLYALTRTGGKDPWAPGDTIPLENIISGQLGDRLHSFLDIKTSAFRKTSLADVLEALQAFDDRLGATVVARHAHESERFAHQFRAFDNGGHLAVAFDKQRGVVSMDLYPHSPSMEDALVHAFSGHIRASGHVAFKALAPDLATPPVVIERAKKRKR